MSIKVIVARRLRVGVPLPNSVTRVVVSLAAVSCVSAPVRSRSPHELAHDQDMTARNLADGPQAFVAVAEVGTDSTLSAQGTICPPAFADPRSGSRLRLVRVLPAGRGDYSTSAEQTYGAKSDELVRVHCANGTPAGIVPR
jgi:hypothetical protein